MKHTNPIERAVTLLIISVFVISTILTLVKCQSKKEQGVNPHENRCPYEGAECPNAQKYLRDYQLDFLTDTIYIYDGDRLVGMLQHDSENPLDSIILKDLHNNE